MTKAGRHDLSVLILRAPAKKTLQFRIVGHKLPGLRFAISDGALVDREPVYLGIQRKDEVIDRVPGDAREAIFTFPVDTLVEPGKNLDFRGPYVHGKKGDRFLYLSWGELGPDGGFTMFRRAKLPLSRKSGEIAPALSLPSPTVECELELTDSEGGPICGTVVGRSPTWRIST